jgi:hypothetical protein
MEISFIHTASEYWGEMVPVEKLGRGCQVGSGQGKLGTKNKWCTIAILL